jgi:hypothetical protein
MELQYVNVFIVIGFSSSDTSSNLQQTGRHLSTEYVCIMPAGPACVTEDPLDTVVGLGDQRIFDSVFPKRKKWELPT